ncbi:MAG: ATP/GTP-binding protein [Methylovulum sp.]|uniref:GTP-binding protein n=1 Tax=Methylovulum sp. TaxID=1916980 RepID=UPI00261A23E7|nr:ATP/GTP-binding protein [Methylovulum sp.]MDD2724484.1 ATP/GTP-binding protein [Methylovulum sp.]MDD5126332.1 ATP/GTP-binding protein [Methylovulum sp.]
MYNPNSHNQIKVVFTGCVGAGKTTAITTISEKPPVSTEVKPSEASVIKRKASTTVAMDYGELTLDGGDKLYLYGTPGQRRFEFMTDILTKGALGLIVLIDNSHENPLDELDYYLNLNHRFLTDNPAVIGITHYDVASQPSVDDYYAALAERGDPWPVIHVDARSAMDVKLLLDTLLAVLEFG